MNRFLVLGAVGLLAVGLSVGATGFTSTDAQRAVQVVVADDENALVGVTACTKSAANGGGNGGDAVRLQVTNQFTDTLRVTSVTSDDAPRTNRGQLTNNDRIEPGDSETFEITFDTSVETITVSLEGGTADVTVTRDVFPKSDCPFSVNERNSGENGEQDTGSEKTGTATDETTTPETE